MFRSHSDRRLLPSITTSPSLGNYMALSSREGLVSAPCVPPSIRPTPNSRARLANSSNLLVHSRSVPSFSQVPQNDELSAALGLQIEHVLEYSKPVPVSHYDELVDDLQALTLEDMPENGGSMDTSISVVFPDQASVSSFAVSQRGYDTPDDMSSVEQYDQSSRRSEPMDTVSVRSAMVMTLPERSSTSTQHTPAHTPTHTSSLTPTHTLSHHSHTFRRASTPDPVSRLSRKRLRTPSRSGSKSHSGSPRELVRALLSSSRSDAVEPATTRAKPADMPELQYLVTYNLVNNFYFNLVSWSPLNNAIAIAIDSKAYWWDGSSQVRDMNIQRPGLAPVACVACSAGDAIAVSFSDGFFCVYPISRRSLPISRRFPSSVQCVEWFPDGKHLFTGESAGTVTLLSFDGATLQVVSHLSAFSQQICGISLSSDRSQVAVGANENLAIVWDLPCPPSTSTLPTERCRLHHTSAVKGIHFCPWAPHLLATGGGSNDRHVRFWHTRSGTLLRDLDTRRQITAIRWSACYKELVLTFGFSTTDDHVAAAVYRYPDTRVVAQAQARDPLRALSATVSPDQTKVAIAANDGTVRVFGLWTERPHALTEAPLAVAAGSYGSAVVERSEGVDVRAPRVR